MYSCSKPYAEIMKYITPPPRHFNVTDTELIADIQRTARKLRKKRLTWNVYAKHGKYSPSSITRRFENWNHALCLAGIKISHRMNIPDEEMMINLKHVWDSLVRAPKAAELAKPLSEFPAATYIKRYGSWYKTLTLFTEWANTHGHKMKKKKLRNMNAAKVRGSRRPSIMLSAKIIKRDHYKCRLCGASPATDPKVKLHIDHIIPWLKGGETVEENLQTLCMECNLGKGVKDN